MYDNVDDFKKKALDNKNDLKRESIDILIGDEEQSFRIAGIGEKAIRLEKFIKYDDIMDAIEDGKDDGLEALIMKFVEDF